VNLPFLAKKAEEDCEPSVFSKKAEKLLLISKVKNSIGWWEKIQQFFVQLALTECVFIV
jgi:hypothetical protein